jgi:putative transposase
VLHKAVKVRLYPTQSKSVLAQHFGCARWWWNLRSNKSIETYRDTGKGLGRQHSMHFYQSSKKDKETEWLGECYSKSYKLYSQPDNCYKNFFDGRARFPRFKSKHSRQSFSTLKCSSDRYAVKLPGKVGTVKAKIIDY